MNTERRLREGKKEVLEARGCPLGTGELSTEDLRTSLTAKILEYASLCEVVGLLETKTVVV